MTLLGRSFSKSSTHAAEHWLRRVVASFFATSLKRGRAAAGLLSLALLCLPHCSSSGGGDDPCSGICLHSNGVTIVADDSAEVGDTKEINGKTYTVVSKTQLETMVDDGDDVTTVVTSKVDDMSALFQNEAHASIKTLALGIPLRSLI